MRRLMVAFVASALLFGLSGAALAAIIVDDHFANGDLGTNPDTGNGFTSATLAGPAWTESGTDASHALGTNAAQRASLQSNDSFVADSTNATRVEWTLSDWSRNNVDSGNGRFVLGVAPSGASGGNPFDNDVDGIWIGMNHDQDAHPGVGVAGITYIDGSTHTALGSGWQWDDNGADTPGATLIDITGAGNSREDRVGIAMNAPDLTVILEIGQDSWSVDFGSTGGGVVLPAAQSGTFSGAGVTNDLSNAIVSVYHQGNGSHFASFDRVVVDAVPDPYTIDDHFANGDLGTNPDRGSGFTSVTISGPPWVEAGTDVSRLSTGGANRASLQSNDSFVADGTNAIRVEWTLSDWSRDNVDGQNGRFVLGVAPSGASGDNPFANDVDGIWIGMNHDQDAHPGVGVAGITYIDGSTHTALGSGWQWDDNGADTPGATLIDITGAGNSREDRVGIAMNAPDLTVSLEIGPDNWSLDFSSTDPSVVLPAAQSGTFSGAGVANDLSNAIVSVYHQGSGSHFASFDRIAVFDPTLVGNVPEPATFALAALGLLGLGLVRRRKRRK